MGDAGHQRDGLCIRGHCLSDHMLFDVALRAPAGTAVGRGRAAPRPGAPAPAGARRQWRSVGTAMTERDPAIEMVGVHKWFGEFHVLRDINLSVSRGERIVICGPS